MDQVRAWQVVHGDLDNADQWTVEFAAEWHEYTGGVQCDCVVFAWGEVLCAEHGIDGSRCVYGLNSSGFCVIWCVYL
jgi:hypothetical protein